VFSWSLTRPIVIIRWYIITLRVGLYYKSPGSLVKKSVVQHYERLVQLSIDITLISSFWPVCLALYVSMQTDRVAVGLGLVDEDAKAMSTGRFRIVSTSAAQYSTAGIDCYCRYRSPSYSSQPT